MGKLQIPKIKGESREHKKGKAHFIIIKSDQILWGHKIKETNIGFF